jgi:hypothetical protein
MFHDIAWKSSWKRKRHGKQVMDEKSQEKSHGKKVMDEKSQEKKSQEKKSHM